MIDDHVRHDVEHRDVQDAVTREEFRLLGQQRHGIPQVKLACQGPRPGVSGWMPPRASI